MVTMKRFNGVYIVTINEIAFKCKNLSNAIKAVAACNGIEVGEDYFEVL